MFTGYFLTQLSVESKWGCKFCSFIVSSMVMFGMLTDMQDPVRATMLCDWRMRRVLLEKRDVSKSCFTPNTQVQHSSVKGLCYPSQAVIT